MTLELSPRYQFLTVLGTSSEYSECPRILHLLSKIS